MCLGLEANRLENLILVRDEHELLLDYIAMGIHLESLCIFLCTLLLIFVTLRYRNYYVCKG